MCRHATRWFGKLMEFDIKCLTQRAITGQALVELWPTIPLSLVIKMWILLLMLQILLLITRHSTLIVPLLAFVAVLALVEVLVWFSCSLANNYIFTLIALTSIV